jgi:putative hydrolase of the HAD superfamily
MIKAVIFDLDNTLLDFMKMKSMAVDSAIQEMIEAGLSIDSTEARNKIFKIYDEKGYEYQEVFDDLIITELGEINYKKIGRAHV